MGGSIEVGYRQRLSDEFYFIPKLGAGVTQIVSGDRRTLTGKMNVALDNPANLTVESYDEPTQFNGDVTLELQSRGGMLAYGKILGPVQRSADWRSAGGRLAPRVLIVRQGLAMHS